MILAIGFNADPHTVAVTYRQFSSTHDTVRDRRGLETANTLLAAAIVGAVNLLAAHSDAAYVATHLRALAGNLDALAQPPAPGPEPESFVSDRED